MPHRRTVERRRVYEVRVRGFFESFETLRTLRNERLLLKAFPKFLSIHLFLQMTIFFLRNKLSMVLAMVWLLKVLRAYYPNLPQECGHDKRMVCISNFCANGFLFHQLKSKKMLSSDTVSNQLQAVMNVIGINSKFTPMHLRKMTATAILGATQNKDLVKTAGGWKSDAVIEQHYIRADVLINTFEIDEGLSREERSGFTSGRRPNFE